MKWEEAEREIEKKIEKDVTDLNTKKSKRNNYRYAKSTPPPHFKVRVGEAVHVYVTWEMLEKCWRKSIGKGKVYDTSVFGTLFSKEKKDHGCYVHVVGKIFEKAGLAKSHADKYYTLK